MRETGEHEQVSGTDGALNASANDIAHEDVARHQQVNNGMVNGEAQVRKVKKQSNLSSVHQQLIEAAKIKDLKTIKTLLADQPELVNQRDKQGRSLLHYAVIQVVDQQDSTGSLKCFNFLQERADQRLWALQDSDGLSLLHLAVISANDALVEHLAEANPMAIRRPLVGTLDRERHSPLHWAVITNSLASVQVLIRAAGVGLAHEPDLNGATPLHYATQTGDFPRYRRQMRRLLAGGESMRAAGDSQELPGDEDEGAGAGKGGTSAGNCEILAFLLSLDGIRLECEDRDKRTPLLWAASSGNWMALDLLLEYGANPLSCDANNLSALHCAASRAHLSCVESLLGNTIRANHLASIKLDPDQLTDKLNCTALFYAVLGGNVDCIELLLERGASPNWQDTKGRTAAHFAALRGQLSALRLMQERGANLWLANKLGDLPLHYAVKSGRQQVVRWLLEGSPYKQSVSAINNLGRAPIHLAVQRNDPALLAYLLQCQPNLAQLAKVRLASTSGSQGKVARELQQQQQKYETALDVAERLGRRECISILTNARAPRAVQVLSERAQVGRAIFKSLEMESPIGFETSCSEALDPSGSRPCSDDLTIAGSSPAAQSHLVANDGWSPLEAHLQKPQEPSSKLLDLERPIGSSNVNHQSTLVIRKVRQVAAGKSGALDEQRIREVVTNVNVYTSPCPHCMSMGNLRHQQPLSITNCSCTALPSLNYNMDPGSSEAATTCGEEDDMSDSEETTLELPQLVDGKKQQHQESNVNYPLTTNANMSFSGEPDQEFRGKRDHSRQVSRLPVIHSEHEQSSDSNSPANEQQQPQQGLPEEMDESNKPSSSMRETQGDDMNKESSDSLRKTISSPAHEVPRFDRFSRDTNKLAGIRKSKVARSPVAEYIHSSSAYFRKANGGASKQRVLPAAVRESNNRYLISEVDSHLAKKTSHHIPAGYLHQRSTQKLAQVKPRAQSNQAKDRLRSKSQTRSLDGYAEGTEGLRNAASRGEQQARSISRQTIIKTRRLSVDSVELALSVEKAIRKYKQESKLFEELQNLKRSQIRSGRSNEALLVKRLVESLRANTNHLLGLDAYSGPYTYKAYERFLYDQLRKLSLSNRAKLSPTHQAQARSTSNRRTETRAGNLPGALRQQPAESPLMGQGAQEYFERFNLEDASADRELRRIISGKTGDDSPFYDLGENSNSSLDQLEAEGSGQSYEDDESLLILESTGALEEIRVKGKSDGGAGEMQREIIHDRLKHHSTSVDSEEETNALDHDDENDSACREEKQHKILQHELSDERDAASLHEEADLLSSAIIVDALGNVSKTSSQIQDPQGRAIIDSDKLNEDKGEIKLNDQNNSNFNVESASPEDDETKQKEKEPDDDDEQKTSVGRRRRSVINIGDKIDIIYHDVGIEIEKVPDREPSLDENEQVAGLEIKSVASEVEQGDLTDSRGKLEGVKEEEEEEEEKAEQPVDSTVQKDNDDVENCLNNSSNKGDEKDVNKNYSMRRASSPPVYEAQRVSKLTDNREKRAQLKRSISVGRDTLADATFTLAKSIPQASGEEEVDDKSKGSKRSEVQKISEISAQNKEDFEELEMASPGDESGGDVKERKMAKRRNLSPKFVKRQRERSRVPNSAYKPQVPLEDIKLRWAQIKANERQVRDAQLRDDDDVYPDRQTEEQQNYKLIYEINAGKQDEKRQQAKGNNNYQASNSMRSIKTNWCHKRIARIVDVRSVKRTLSLPESLIYSNDLLKRFNILKL